MGARTRSMQDGVIILKSITHPSFSICRIQTITFREIEMTGFSSKHKQVITSMVKQQYFLSKIVYTMLLLLYALQKQPECY